MDYRLLSSIHVIHPVFRFRNFESLSLYYEKVLANGIYRTSVLELCFRIVCDAGGRAVCGSFLAGNVGSNSADDVNTCLL